MSYYKITKSYRNARDVYYIQLERGEIPDQEMLESIGENTEGGHGYGYQVSYEKVRYVPKNAIVLPRKRTVVVY